jgi:hypothetical protein
MGLTAFNFKTLVRYLFGLKINVDNVFFIGFIAEALLLLLVRKHWFGGSSYYLFCAVFFTPLSGWVLSRFLSE